MRVPALSFRAKLLLAMVLLVGGVSASTLYFSRLILQRSYLEALQEQFRSQIAFFTERQSARLSEIQSRCATLASSATLRTALADRDAGRAYTAVREALALSLGEAMGGGRGGPWSGGTNRVRPAPPPETPPGMPSASPAFGPAPNSGSGRTPEPPPGRSFGRGRLGGVWGQSLRVLDAEGRVLPPDLPGTFQRTGGSPEGRGGGGPARRLDDQLAELGQSIASWDDQQVAYLAPESDTAGRTFLEVVATRVTDPASGRTLGAVVLGAPLFDQAEEMRDLSDILTGFWLEGRLHTHTIPAGLQPALTERLNTLLAKGGEPPGDFQLRHAAGAYRVFLRLLNPGSPFPLTWQIKLYSLDGALRMERRLQSIILLISLLVLAAGAGVSLILANRLTLSVRELDAATAQVLRGNFKVEVPVRSRDDVGRLVDSFNQMTRGLEEKDRYRRVLNLVAGSPVAAQLVDARPPAAGGCRRITVLFCDVRQFTALTQGMPPDQVIQLLNAHMTAMTQVVDAHGGFVDKFVGDLVMAVFGAPASTGEDAARAVACAHRMMEVRAALNRGADHPLGIGIGIATGEAIAGLMGSSDRANYTVLGGCVNLGSRLCAEARPGQVLLDATTRELVAGSVQTAALPPLRLKGFPDPVPAWQVALPDPTGTT